MWISREIKASQDDLSEDCHVLFLKLSFNTDETHRAGYCRRRRSRRNLSAVHEWQLENIQGRKPCNSRSSMCSGTSASLHQTSELPRTTHDGRIAWSCAERPTPAVASTESAYVGAGCISRAAEDWRAYSCWVGAGRECRPRETVCACEPLWES